MSTIAYAPEAEVSVLGGMLLDPAAVARGLELLKPAMFHSRKNRAVFEAMGEMFGRNEPIEPPAIIEHLRAKGQLGDADYAFIAELLDTVPTAANIDYYCGVVRENAQLRALSTAGEMIQRIVADRAGRPVGEIIDQAQRAVFESSEYALVDSGLEPLRNSLQPTFIQIEEYQSSGGGIQGVGTGLYDLDEMTGGFRKGNFIVIAGRPSMGKTAIVNGVVLHASVQQQIPTAVFSLEMTKEEFVERMLCHEALVDLGKMRRGKLSDDDLVRLSPVASLLAKAPIWIDDSGYLTVMSLRAKARRLKLEQPDLGLIVVDYVQLMRGDGENRTQEVSGISQGLKAIAKELQVPVIALSQLSRAPEARPDRRPVMSDLRESGSLEQDADIVGLLFRPEYYFGAAKDGKNIEGEAELILGKQRNGPTGSVKLFFRKECVRFENFAQDWKLRVS